jgi:hypothetical protein
LTFSSAADAAARAAKNKSEAPNARMTILLFTRKGLRWTDCAGLLALRVRMARAHPVRPAAFPGSFPVAGGSFLAYSCAAAWDSHPLPSLRQAAKTRLPKDLKKNQKTRARNLPTGGRGSQMVRMFRQLISLDSNEQHPRWRHPERSRPSGGVRDLLHYRHLHQKPDCGE